jgi:HD superfamily phosphohydrolase
LFTSGHMQKLARIKQLGPAHLVYPGAVHTRLDHSLGVFHATRLIVLSLLTQIQREGTSRLVTEEGINALLAAAMLHDLGHFPYAHALKDVIGEEHEALGAKLIASDRQLGKIIEENLGTRVETVCAIIDTSLPCDDPETTFLRTILSGTLDPDKLDYLSRDALFCGIPYGIQDASYIIRHLAILAEDLSIGLPFGAIGSVEHLLFAKYSMYRNVYWHHGTRSATAMIKKAVNMGFNEGLFTEYDLYGRDDESFASLFLEHPDSTATKLFTSVRENNLLVPKVNLPFIRNTKHDQLYTDATMKESIEREVYERLRVHHHLAPHEVIIDIPEDVSFEAEIPILMEDGNVLSFSQVDELFNPTVVKAFTSSLRKIRLFTKDSVPGAEALEIVEGILDTHD